MTMPSAKYANTTHIATIANTLGEHVDRTDAIQGDHAITA